MHQCRIAISLTEKEGLAAAKEWAHRLGLEVIEGPDTLAAQAYSYVLVLTAHYLGITKPSQPGKRKPAPFYINFLANKILYRACQASLRKETLARAIGIHPRDNPTIIDGTAGLGRDSFILAKLGFNVVLLERSPIIHALLSDALSRAHQDPRTAPIAARMRLIHAESAAWLARHQADVVYLDPMFPERQKSASVKKEMVILRELLGKSNKMEDDELLKQSLACAKHRVVVKRHRLAPSLSADRPADFSLSEKSCRFDVYLKKPQDQTWKPSVL